MKKSTKIALAGLCVMAVPILAVVGAAAHVKWAAEDQMFTPEEVPTTEVGIILGAQAKEDGRPSGFLMERLRLGMRLFESGKVKHLVVSGSNRASDNHETDVMERWLINHGVPPEAITNDPHGYDTYDTCVRAKDVYRWDEVTLISQAYHVPRAITICNAIGLKAVGVGDERAKRWQNDYSIGEMREYPANLKMEWDLLIRRTPNLER